MNEIKYKCPICGKTEFSGENTFEICNYCGWQNEGIQSENPNFWGGANDLSLKDYKKNYQELLKVDSNYKWSKNDKKIEFEKIEKNIKHLCPVCNKYYFSELDSHESCKICGWIDNWTQEKFPNYENSSNELSLEAYKNKYEKRVQGNIDNGRNSMQNWFKSFKDLKKAIEGYFDYQIDFYYEDKMCTIGRDNSAETNKKYGHDIYYIAGWEKDMKKTFNTLEELSEDRFFEGKTLLEVWDKLKFDNLL